MKFLEIFRAQRSLSHNSLNSESRRRLAINLQINRFPMPGGRAHENTVGKQWIHDDQITDGTPDDITLVSAASPDSGGFFDRTSGGLIRSIPEKRHSVRAVVFKSVHSQNPAIGQLWLLADVVLRLRTRNL